MVFSLDKQKEALKHVKTLTMQTEFMFQNFLYF